MLLAFVTLVPLLVVASWAYFRFSPSVAPRRGLIIYNVGVLFVTVVLCLVLTSRLYVSLSGGPDRAWWPVLSLLGSLGIFSVCFLVAGLIRNLVVFRR